MEWAVVILIWVVVFIKLFWPKQPEYSRRNIAPIVTKEVAREEDVTVEDMILHDMQNTDDVYDIGKIDFNE